MAQSETDVPEAKPVKTEEQDGAIKPAEATSLDTADDPEEIEPNPPGDLADGEDEDLQEKAKELAKQAQSAETVEEREEVMQIGGDLQSESTQNLDLLKARTEEVLKEFEDGEKTDIPDNLREFEETLSELNPSKIEENPHGFLPTVKHTFGMLGVADVLNMVEEKYDTVQDTLKGIERNLEQGREQLKKDILELENLFQQTLNNRDKVRRKAYLGELLLKELEEKRQNISDSVKSKRLDTVVNQVVSRVQDLRQLEQVLSQGLLRTQTNIENNRRLASTIKRYTDIAEFALVIGLGNKVAQQRQKSMIEMVEKSRDFTSDLIKQNAEDARKQTEEIGELMKSPALRMDKLKEAFELEMKTRERLHELRQEAIKEGKKNINEVNEMNQAIESEVDEAVANRKQEDEDDEAGTE